MHGANRLGGNGVANSTVYGGISGDVMAAFVAGEGAFREPDMAVAEAAVEASLRPFGAKAGGLYELRGRLDDLMWDKVGIIREAGEMTAALAELDDMTAELEATGIPDTGREFNITWHDWLNLESLLLVSKSHRGGGAGPRGFPRRALSAAIFPIPARWRKPPSPR